MPVIRIYDIVFDYENLLGTDRFYRTLCRGEPFQKTMGTAEFHHLVGKYLAAREDETGRRGKSLLAAAYRCGVPVFTSSPGDSSIGMNLAALQLEGYALRIDPLRDVNQSAAHRLGRQEARPERRVDPRRRLAEELLAPNRAADPGSARPGGKRPRLFPADHRRPSRHGRPERRHPGEAMTWGKVDADKLPDTVTCYVDSTVALPLLTAYALAKRQPRPHRRLMDRLDTLMKQLETEYHNRPAKEPD